MDVYLASVKEIQSARDPFERNHVLIRDMYSKFICQVRIHCHTVSIGYQPQRQDICQTRGIIPHGEIAKLSLLISINGTG